MSGLIARGLVAGTGGFRLGPVDVELRAGETLALVGPNGCGKTTLLRTLAGLAAPLAGRIEGPASRAWLPPPGAVQAGFEVLHLVALGRAGRRRWARTLDAADRVAAREALARLELDDLADRPFDRLSSGQQQLVLMARTLVQDAPVCLLDEPTAMLDPAHRRRVEAAMRALTAEGRIVIVATHGLDLARGADQVLTPGPVCGIGTPEAVLAPARLEALFGVAADPCPCCGQTRFA